MSRRSAGWALALLSATGCGIGRSHVLFVSKQSALIDCDTIPAELSLSLGDRFQGLVTPTFGESDSPPVISYFGVQADAQGASLPSLFACGAAAVRASVFPEQLDVDEAVEMSALEMMGLPSSNAGSCLGGGEPIENGLPCPMWFAVEDTVGLQLEFAGPAYLPLPQSLVIGARRKALLLAPLHQEGVPGESGRIYTPSTIAFYNESVRTSLLFSIPARPFTGDRLSYQFLATGRAATILAGRPDVRLLIHRGVENELRGYEDRLLGAAEAVGLFEGVDFRRASELERLRDFYHKTGKAELANTLDSILRKLLEPAP